MIDVLYIVVVGGVIVAFASLVYWTMRNGISPMPSSYKTRMIIFALVRDLSSLMENQENEPIKHSENSVAGTKSYTLVDPGSGWGTLAVPLSRLLPRWSIHGFESSPIPYWYSKLYAWVRGSNNIFLIRKDFRAINFSNARIIVCYLFPEGMKTIKEEVMAECRGSSLYLVSNTFSVPGWEPEKTITVGNIYRTKIFLYRLNI